MKPDKAVYRLTIEDVQNVANQELERNLTTNEIESIKEIIADKINWYDAIADAISEKINTISV